MSRVMITNGGPHPPEKWAMTTAERIFDIGTSIAGDRLIQAQKFQLAIAEILMPHHDKVQSTERSKLGADGKNMLAPYSVDDYLDHIMDDVIAVSEGTPWQAHFAKPDVQTVVREVIASHIATEQHVERLWHAEQNPDSAESQSYLSRGV